MTKLEKAIDTAKTLSAEDLSEEELELLVTAASSWAALVLHPLSRHPERDGDYFGWSLNMKGELKHKTVLTWGEGEWWREGSMGLQRVSGSAFVWLDGYHPPHPEATDEG